MIDYFNLNKSTTELPFFYDILNEFGKQILENSKDIIPELIFKKETQNYLFCIRNKFSIESRTPFAIFEGTGGAYLMSSVIFPFRSNSLLTTNADIQRELIALMQTRRELIVNYLSTMSALTNNYKPRAIGHLNLFEFFTRDKTDKEFYTSFAELEKFVDNVEETISIKLRTNNVYGITKSTTNISSFKIGSIHGFLFQAKNLKIISESKISLKYCRILNPDENICILGKNEG